MSEASTAIDERLDIGWELSRLLSGSWRSDRSTPPTGAALTRLLPLLLEAGAAGLVWRQLGSSESAVRALRQVHRRYILECGTLEDHLEEILSRLRSAGLDPIHIKGWSTARLYPDAGLRPYSDIDLCLPPAHLKKAMPVPDQDGGLRGVVDLHEGVPDLPDRPWDELYRRSRLVRLHDSDVRILGPEDHLRLTCFHLLRHGAWCPLGLCDVAVILESTPAEFDWDYCLQGSRPRKNWLLAVVGLAIRLLNARVANPAIRTQASQLPAWLVPTVLQSWGSTMEMRGWDADNLNLITAKFRLGLSPAAPVPPALIQLAAFATRTLPSLARAGLRKLRRRETSSFAIHRGKRFLGGCLDFFTERRLRRPM
jgi:hypothetical protein